MPDMQVILQPCAMYGGRQCQPAERSKHSLEIYITPAQSPGLGVRVMDGDAHVVRQHGTELGKNATRVTNRASAVAACLRLTVHRQAPRTSDLRAAVGAQQ